MDSDLAMTTPKHTEHKDSEKPGSRLFPPPKEPRKSNRVFTNLPVKCRVLSGITFQQSKLFSKSKWQCINFSSHGITLQSQSKNTRFSNRYLKRLQKFLHVLSRRFKKKSARVHYPPLPPRDLEIVIEFTVPGTKNIFTLHGRLIWFRPLWTDAYRMGVRFDEPQQFIVHEHGDGNVYMTTFFPKEIV